MLIGLNVKNIVLIERLDLTFSRGLSVLTGETGAGKSILLDALGLSIGARADAGLVRAEETQASVIATFEVPSDHAARSILAESDIEDDEDVLVLRRTLGADGRSRAYVNDRPVSVALLRRLGESMLEVHGQFDDRGLMDRQTHREALDAFGGLGTSVESVSTAYVAWRQAEAELNKARTNAAALDEEISELRRATEELSELAPEFGEEAALAEKRTMLMNAEQLVEAVNGSIAELDGEEMATGRLRNAQRYLERVVSKAGGSLDAASAAAERARVEIEEVLHELHAAAADIEGGDMGLPAIEDRLFALRDAARKYGVEADALVSRLEGFQSRLDEIFGGGDLIATLKEASERTRSAFLASAETLSSARREAAGRLDAVVTGELPPLKLEKASFQTAVEPLEEGEWSEHGCDLIEFRIATNPGSLPGPLAKIASGGELARFMLALKIALVGVGTAGTLIFDEVDSGVGGATADAVGERLERLGAEKQVLVVTHSPQVAARGDDHLKVEKQSDAVSAATIVSRLESGERREEVARMLSGQSITDEARGAADRLMRRENA
jgi:DNA repair protein RecN (Recombination protein N)